MYRRSSGQENDVRSLQIFLAEMRKEVSQAGYFQFGDLMWRIHYPPNHFDWTTDLRIWNDGKDRIGGRTGEGNAPAVGLYQKLGFVITELEPVSIPALVASWPEQRWQWLEVAEGEKGLRLYDWACQRIVESQEQLPGRDAWLLARRSLTKPDETAFYLSNAPAETDLLTLAQVGSTRFTVVQCIEEAKGETGLDHYEVRYCIVGIGISRYR